MIDLRKKLYEAIFKVAAPTGIVTAQIAQTPKKSENPCPNCNHTQHDSDANYCKKCGTTLTVEDV